MIVSNKCKSTIIHMFIDQVLAYVESNGVAFPLQVDDH